MARPVLKSPLLATARTVGVVGTSIARASIARTSMVGASIAGATIAGATMVGAGIVGVGVIGGVAVPSAQAAVLNYSFEVTVDRGLYTGNTYKGAFSFESSALVPCLTSPARLCATPGQSDLKLTFDFLGNTYTEKSDVEYALSGLQFPAIYYYPENIARGYDPYLLSLIVLPPTSNVSFSVLGYSFFSGFATVGNASDPTNYAGRVSYKLEPPPKPPGPKDPCLVDPASCPGTAVPEPSEIVGSVAALGLLGLFWRSRRKRVPLKEL